MGFSFMQNIYLSQSKGMISVKKWLSLSLALCMLLSLFCGTAVFAAADTQYETVMLNGFTQWTQAELDSSSGNNGYANGCSAALTVVTDDAYIVGGGKQAIKAVHKVDSDCDILI